MMHTADLLNAIRVHGLMRAASHVETLAAADISAGTDSARRIELRPVPPYTRVIVTRISAQGIKPSNLTIDANDLNRAAFRLHLDTQLVIEGIPLIGDETAGVVLTVRNSAAKTVDLLIQTAMLRDDEIDRLLGPISRGPAR